MKNNYLLLLFIISLFSCTSEEKPIENVFGETERGAVLRTIGIENLTFDTSAPERPIQISLEYQDNENGTLLKDVRISITFIDNTPSDGDNSQDIIFLKTILLEEFMDGANGFPVADIMITTQELLDAFSLDATQISCTDTFVIDLSLHLVDGRVFTNANSTTAIRSFGGFLNSPFTYDVHVVEGIDDQLFIGDYNHTSIKDGFSGPTFFLPERVQLNTPRPNVRSFELIRIRSTDSIINQMEFTIACDQAILTRYVRSRFKCSPLVEDEHVVLLGPDDQLSGSINSIDDAVFDLRFLEAVDGNDGFCDWPLTQSEVRFSRQ